ncbi:MAG TPA: hypothetical protein VM619_14675 [Luteimonas sp.]|nr:hypothetical protein [Luteimonas sp.]
MSAGAERVDVLPGEARITLTEYTPGITTTIAEAVMAFPAGTYWIVPDEARDAVRELIDAARFADSVLARDGFRAEDSPRRDLRDALARVEPQR